MRLLSLVFLLLMTVHTEGQDYTKYVNPFIGTGGHGHTFPGATSPFGMVQLSPDTRLDGWDGCSGYHYSDSVIYGFSHTHLSGTGVSDYGDVLLMPSAVDVALVSGSLDGFATTFSHEKEAAWPGRYEVFMDNGAAVRLTTTPHCGHHQYAFNDASKASVVLDLLHRDKVLGAGIEVINDSTIVGHRISSAWATEQHVYFAITFSKPWKELEKKDSTLFKFSYNTDKLQVKVGLSAVSTTNALLNLKTELPHWEINVTQRNSIAEWNKVLGKIQVEDTNTVQKTIFYTALYHSMIAPNIFSDVNGDYRGTDLKIHHSDDHTQYTIFSLWDTFRATHPLLNIIETKRSLDFIKTFLAHYKEGGKLPVWELAGNYTGCMIGYHSAPVILDAYEKGITEFDVPLAIEAMAHSGKIQHLGIPCYQDRGFIDASIESESVSKTLEYAFDDWCIGTFADNLGNSDVAETFLNRSNNHRNLYNPETGFYQAKFRNKWQKNFVPSEVNFNYTEANAWHYSLFAPHDLQFLIEQKGEEGFEKFLDDLFTTSPDMKGRHQVDITGIIGQYAHGNEPSHHMAYLYNYIGKPWKTQEILTHIKDRLYTDKPDGLCGNEDCGQMSSWMVFSQLGFYPVTPGLPKYAIGIPTFDKASIVMENGNTFTVIANKTNGTKYIKKATFKGKPLPRSFITHAQISWGGVLEIELSDEPNMELWTALKERPVTKSKRAHIAPPTFHYPSNTFTDTLRIEMSALQKDATIMVKVNDNEWSKYVNYIGLTESSTIKAYTELDGEVSTTLTSNFTKVEGGATITNITEFANSYSAEGMQTLVDGQRGAPNYRTGSWQGTQGKDIEIMISLDETKDISLLSLGTLQDIKSWIFYPKSVTYFSSTDGSNYKELGTVNNDSSDKEEGVFTQQLALKLTSAVKANHLKIVVKHYGVIPDWHLGAGGNSWTFLDEITIQ